MRKAFVAALAALAGMSVSAHSADIYNGSLKDEPVAYTPAPIWAGLYVGGHIGGLWNDEGTSSAFTDKLQCSQNCKDNADYKPTSYFTFEDDDDLSLLGGVHLGYNWQDGAKVYGIEGDVSFSDGVDYLASLRARLGHLLDDDLMIYATAGVAFVGFEDKTIKAVGEHHSKTVEFSGDSEVGFVVGGGIERKLASNMSIGLEGLYYFFDDAKYSSNWEHGDWCNKIEHEDDNDLFVVRARLSYHLQRDEPTLDSYK